MVTESICLGEQLRQLNYRRRIDNHILITQAADFAWHNELRVTGVIEIFLQIINTYSPVSHLFVSDLKTKAITNKG